MVGTVDNDLEKQLIPATASVGHVRPSRSRMKMCLMMLSVVSVVASFFIPIRDEGRTACVSFTFTTAVAIAKVDSWDCKKVTKVGLVNLLGAGCSALGMYLMNKVSGPWGSGLGGGLIVCGIMGPITYSMDVPLY